MRRLLLEYLVCPDCQKALTCQVSAQEEEEIKTGNLSCPQCSNVYPIIRGIPRFVTTERPLSGENVKTAEAFGWEWQTFDSLHGVAAYEHQFLDWIYPLQPNFFQGKVVLDAGCGMGRFALTSSNFGAKTVLAVDASEAVEAAYRNAQAHPDIQVIQADIHRLPLRRGSQAQMDFIFSIGVIHHLDHPQPGFKALAQHLQPAGRIFIWIYGRENNDWLVNYVNPVRTLLTSRLPRPLLYLLSWLITLGLQPCLKLVYRPLNKTNMFSRLRQGLPYNDYLAWLSQFEFHHNHHVVFDHLVAPVAFYIRREEFESWFQQARMKLIDLSWRNRNSWRGHGEFVEKEAIQILEEQSLQGYFN